MSESHEFWWKESIRDNRTLSAEMKGPAHCIVERQNGMVMRIVYMTKDQMRQIGLDCLRLVK